MKLVTRIYMAVVASLLLFLVATLLLVGVLGGIAHHAYTQEVAVAFKNDIAPMLNANLQTLKDFKEPQHLQHNFARNHNNMASAPPEPPPIENNKHLVNNPQAAKQFQLVRQIKRQLRTFNRQYHTDIDIVRQDNSFLFHTGEPKHHKPIGVIEKLFTNKNSVAVPLQHSFKAVISTFSPPLDAASFGVRFVVGLGVLFLCAGVIAYPLSKRITKRLNTLSDAVSHWGDSKQGSHAEKLHIAPSVLAGNDEIAQLAKRFAAASERISSLLAAHRLLLANASHEIRTPLTRIRLNMEMLDNIIAEDKRTDFAKRETAIKRNLAELDALVESILQSSRLDAQDALIDAEPLDLHTLVIKESEHYTGVQITGKSVCIQAQKNLIIQLIRNLLDNAFKHGKPPVNISITQTHSPQHSVVFSITDTGGGVAADKLDSIFEPFVRLNNHTKGNGLGLNLVKKIVTLHGGHINVTSDAAGTTFTVQLPAYTSAV